MTSLVLFRMCDILKHMENIQINCNYCNSPVVMKRDKIYMQCHCDDDRRIIEHPRLGGIEHDRQKQTPRFWFAALEFLDDLAGDRQRHVHQIALEVGGRPAGRDFGEQQALTHDEDDEIGLLLGVEDDEPGRRVREVESTVDDLIAVDEDVVRVDFIGVAKRDEIGLLDRRRTFQEIADLADVDKGDQHGGGEGEHAADRQMDRRLPDELQDERPVQVR